MKQRTSVYLDDLDREAVRKVAEYYGITSDTDVLCFSVRSVARAITAIRARKPLRIIQGMKRRSLFGEGEGSALSSLTEEIRPAIIGIDVLGVETGKAHE